MNDNRIALITGGSRGLGRSAALHLARRRVGVVFTYHTNRAAAEAVVAEVEASGGRAVALQLDMGRVAGFAAFAAELRAALEANWNRSTFDYLVNNAGGGIWKSFADTTETEFDEMMNTHLKGVFFLTQALLPMIERGGRILNVSSGLTRFTMPGYAAYATMKGGAEVLTRYIARELGAQGIAANTLAPGAIETDFGGGAVRDNAELNRMIAGTTAMGRVGLPDDIGAAVAGFLADGSQWMTGQRIEVSGGMNL